MAHNDVLKLSGTCVSARALAISSEMRPVRNSHNPFVTLYYFSLSARSCRYVCDATEYQTVFYLIDCCALRCGRQFSIESDAAFLPIK